MKLGRTGLTAGFIMTLLLVGFAMAHHTSTTTTTTIPYCHYWDGHDYDGCSPLTTTTTTTIPTTSTIHTTTTIPTTTTTINYCSECSSTTVTTTIPTTTVSVTTTIQPTTTIPVTTTIENTYNSGGVGAGVPDAWGVCMFYEQFNTGGTVVSYWVWYTKTIWTLNCLSGLVTNTGKPLV